MADKLMRYDIELEGDDYDISGWKPIENETGDWVKYSDVAALETKNNGLHHEAAEHAANMKRLMFCHRAALEALRKVEWWNDNGVCHSCPTCERGMMEGHAPGCSLDAVIHPNWDSVLHPKDENHDRG